MVGKPEEDTAAELLALHDQLDAIRFSGYKLAATGLFLAVGIVDGALVAFLPNHSGWVVPACAMALGVSFSVEELRKARLAQRLRRRIDRIQVRIPRSPEPGGPYDA